MAQGSVTPAIQGQWRSSGGLFVPLKEPAPIDYASVYLVLEDYAPATDAQQAVRLVDDIVRSCDRDALLLALATLNHIQEDEVVMRELAQDYAGELPSYMRARLLGVVDPRQTESRRFLSRQGVLAAMKEALRAGAVPQSAQPSQVLVAAILLVHASSTLLAVRTRDSRDELMMELFRNVAFNAKRNTPALLSDHVELWEGHGGAAVAQLGTAAMDLLKSSVGLDMRDLIAFGFAVASSAITWEPGAQLLVDPTFPGSSRKQEDIDAFLDAVTATPDELAAHYSSLRAGSWNYIPFQRAPVVRLSNGRLLVLDLPYLLERVTDGAYWDVHDWLRDSHGDAQRLAWTRAFGEMVERFVSERMPLLAPAGLGSPAYFSEDEVRAAYPGKKACDGVIDFGGVFLAMEVVSGRLTVASRVFGDIGAFRRDTEKIVLKKARQLDATARSLINNASALTGSSAAAYSRVCPLLVAGGGYPAEPLTAAYIRQEVDREGRSTTPGSVRSRSSSLRNSRCSWGSRSGVMPRITRSRDGSARE